MENILIKFEADTTALDEISQKLGTVKQAMAGIVTGGGSSTAGGTSTAKGTTDNSEKQRLDETRKATALLIADNHKLMKDYDDLAKKYNASQNIIKTSATDSKKSMDALANAQKNVNAQIGNTAATESFRTQLKRMKAEIIALDMAGQNGSARYNELVQKAGELKDAMSDTGAAISNSGSDTQAFDSIAGGLQLATGAFTAYQGAAALFGISGEDMQKTMERLQAGIALTVGLQQGLNVVQKDGALIVGVSRIITIANTKAEAYSRLIRIQGTSATLGATIAQKAFNLVAMANPYVLVAVALMTVVGAIWAFNKGADDAVEKQAKLNELETLRVESLDRISQKYKDAGDEREKALANDLELAKASGASLSEIAKKERELAVERFINATSNAAFRGDEVAALDENKKKVDILRDALASMVAEKNAGKDDVTFKVGAEIQTVKINEEGKKKIQDQIDSLNISIKTGSDLKDVVDSTKQGLDALAAKQIVDAKKNAQSEAIAVASIKLINSKKGSAEELAAKIGMIETQRRIDMASTTSGLAEKRLKMIKANKDIEDANRAFALAELNDEKALIEAKISLSKKGSDGELANQKDLLDKQLEIELADANLSVNKRKAINDKYLGDLDQMEQNYYFKKSSQSLQDDISLINAQLSNVQIGSAKEYQLKASLIEKQKAIDIKAVQNSIESELTKISKIKEINAKGQKEIADLTYTTQTASLEKNTATAELALSEEYANGLMSKAEFEAKKEMITVNSLKRQIDIEAAAGKDGLVQKQELLDKELKMIEDANALKKELFSESMANITGLFNAIQEGQTQEIAQQMEYLKNHYTTDVEEAKKNKELKLISQADYDKRQNALALKQKNAEKASKRFSILAGAAESIGKIIFKALETQAAAILNPFLLPLIPFIWGQIPLVGASAAIQLGTINKYAKGRKGGSGQGEMAWVGEQGPEIMFVPNSASIIPANKSRRVSDAIGIMREYNIPVMPHVSKSAMEEAKVNVSGINYKLLANEIGEQMKKNLIIPKSDQRTISINVDQSGTKITDGDTTTRYRNRKYSGEI